MIHTQVHIHVHCVHIKHCQGLHRVLKTFEFHFNNPRVLKSLRLEKNFFCKSTFENPWKWMNLNLWFAINRFTCITDLVLTQSILMFIWHLVNKTILYEAESQFSRDCNLPPSIHKLLLKTKVTPENAGFLFLWIPIYIHVGRLCI